MPHHLAPRRALGGDRGLGGQGGHVRHGGHRGHGHRGLGPLHWALLSGVSGHWVRVTGDTGLTAAALVPVEGDVTDGLAPGERVAHPGVHGEGRHGEGRGRHRVHDVDVAGGGVLGHAPCRAHQPRYVGSALIFFSTETVAGSEIIETRNTINRSLSTTHQQ